MAKARTIPTATLFFLLFLYIKNSNAQPGAPKEQTSEQDRNAAVVAAAKSPDMVTVPDGTPITLKLEENISSATAKVGDTVKFTIPYPLRVNGMVIVPAGTVVSGLVVGVSHRRRGARDGEVKIATWRLSLPSGETATLRQVLKSAKAVKKVGTVAVMSPAVALSLPFVGWMLPALLFTKGDERVYRSGTWMTVYFDGPLRLNRGELDNLEPPPYKGPPQVFIKSLKGTGYNVMLFSNQEFVAELSKPVRLELKPGTYSLSTSKANEQPLQLEVHEDEQYWVEREHGGLFVRNARDHRDEIEELEGAPWVTERNFALETPAYRGPAQVFFVNRGGYVDLFCGEKKFASLSTTLRIEVDPGNYTFSTGRAIKQRVQLEVRDDHQYWIERDGGRLLLKDFQRLHDDAEQLELQQYYLDLTLPSTRKTCLSEALP